VFRSERLSAEHALDRFVSGNADLDAWLVQFGLTADRAGTARVRIWLDDDHEVMGYFAIAPHTIRRVEVPPAVGRGSPDTIPAFLLARLAIAEDRQGAGHGGEALVEALTATLGAIGQGGGRLIVVDAIDDRARAFYEHFGFRTLPDVPDRLVMKASTAAASMGIAWPSRSRHWA
jgi:GNAT superfamily N-acetyltransferase